MYYRLPVLETKIPKSSIKSIMSKKLYIYTICLAIVYVIFVGDQMYESFGAFKAGFDMSMKSTTESKEGRPINIHQFFGFKLTASDGMATFPSTIINEKTGENIKLEIREAFVLLSQLPKETPPYILIIKNLIPILSFLMFGIFIYIPIMTFKIMKSISKNQFYSLKNIKNMRNVSISLLAMFVVIFVESIIMDITSRFYVQLAGYDISVMKVNYAFLFLGLVLLIMSEILRYTTTMKEEQEFTI